MFLLAFSIFFLFPLIIFIQSLSHVADKYLFYFMFSQVKKQVISLTYFTCTDDVQFMSTKGARLLPCSFIS